MRWQESQPTVADNIDMGPVTGTNWQDELVEASGIRLDY